MKINADELNKLYEKILAANAGDDVVSTKIINTLGDLKKPNFFKRPIGNKLLFKGHNGKLYYFFSGDAKASKLNNQVLTKFNITNDALKFMRSYLGEDFKPIYLNVNDLYKVADTVYNYMKEKWPQSSQYSNMLRSINYITVCGNGKLHLFKNEGKHELHLTTYEGRIYQWVWCNDEPCGTEMFISNSILMKYPLTPEGELFVEHWLNKYITESSL